MSEPGYSSRKPEPFLVRGSTIRSKLEIVRDRFGEAPELRLRELLRREGISSILDSQWYPFSTYDRVNLAIAEHCFEGDVARLTEIGEESARHALTGIYKIYAAKRDFGELLTRLSTLHRRFYNLGRMEVIMAEEGHSCEILLTEAPYYPPSDIYIAQGFYVGAAKVLGLQSIQARNEQAPGRVRFSLSWAADL